MDTEKVKILALSTSPSRGRNSDSMLDAFIKGVKKEGVEIEKIYLSDIPIETYSFSNSFGPTDSEPHFADLLQKIKSAQGLVIATPTYNFSVPAHLKNFIDRLRCIALDITHKNKLGQPKGILTHLKMYFLISGGTPKWAETLLFFAFPAFWLRAVFLYYNSHCYGGYYSGNVTTFKNQKILLKCERLGKRYARKIKRNASHSLLENLFWRPPQKD